MTCFHSFVGCSRGAAAAELALMLPLLVVMLFGSIEVSYYFYNQHQVVKGVRDGARYGGRQSFMAINCTGAPTSDGVVDQIKEVARTGRIAGGTARVPGWTNGHISVDVSCAGDEGTPLTTGIYSSEPDAPIITVSTTVPYQPLFAGVGVLTSGFALSATQQAAVMGI